MTKRKLAANTTAIIVLLVINLILAITAFINNRYINTLSSELNEAHAENSRLERELESSNLKVEQKEDLVELKSMQLIYKSDVYKQETMREEGIRVQEYYEGLDKE